MSVDRNTVASVIEFGSADSPAIGAPGRDFLSYAGLRTLVAATRLALHAVHLGRNDRVAIVLPNGPEMATAFLAVSSCATAAPLNPALKHDEFEFCLADLGVRALIVQDGVETPARAAASKLGIPILELAVGSGPAGEFTLSMTVDDEPIAKEADEVQSSDVGLILHTSGTTARPKIVPLLQSNIAASARNIGQTLGLGPSDVCLNIMPLFHIHGLIAAVLSSIASGGTVICTPGLSAFRFFSWMGEFKPTWYTAVPTMHQTLLELTPRFKNIIAEGRLRFIRSSSAPLGAPVMAALESQFGVPVIEAYGMTEASHQMASNPLPPLRRYAGSVGISAGSDVAIMDEAGTLLPVGEVGEVVVRGTNVTAGYENNPGANAASFINGWFRTGDLGVLDEDGYLRLTGRLKEIINRAGEKISPIEIDNVLAEHPAVQQVVTFSIPSKLFGEEVAAAVVLRDGMTTDSEALRNYVADRVAAFKVPREIVFLSEIPKGPTGKLQRIGLAAQLGFNAKPG